jgi:DNA-binding response OmpR family regulator
MPESACCLVWIDGAPYLRLGPGCGLLAYLAGTHQRPRRAVSLDPATKLLLFGKRGIGLTRKEFQLMSLLLRAEEGHCSYGDLLEALWPARPYRSGITSLRGIVLGLRRKLRAAGLPDTLITNMHGRGLRLDESAC